MRPLNISAARRLRLASRRVAISPPQATGRIRRLLTPALVERPRALATRLAGIARSLPFLGVAVALFTWPSFPLTPSPGLDASWGAGLYMAAREGLVFGRDLVFTYGPLGFLSLPSFWYEGPGVAAFVFSGLLHVTACTLVLWAACKVFDRFFAVIVAVIACSFLGPPLVVIALIASATVARGRTDERLERFFPALIASLGAFAFLVKVNFGIEILAIGAIAVLASNWGRWLRLAEFAAAFVASLIVFWMIAGQPLGALPDYISLSKEVVAGYSQTMELSYPGPASYVFLAIGVIAGLAAVAWVLNGELDRRRRALLTGLIALFGFFCFKEGFVRQDSGHIALFTSSIVSAWFVLGWKPRPGWQGVACLIGVLSIATYFQPGTVDPLSRIDSARRQISTVIEPSSRRAALEAGRESVLAAAAIDPAMVARLKGASIHIDPYETSVAWALGLDWKPLPVFQDYLAFTSTLDRQNADALRSTAGPELILRRLDPAAIDGRLAAFNPPEANLETLCNYEPTMVRGEWILLRKNADRCGRPRSMGTVSREPGKEVPVPQAPPGSLVTASIRGAALSARERARASLFRAKPSFITLVPGPRAATAESFRLVPGTAADKLIMSAPPSRDYPAPFAVAPGARALIVSGAGLDGPIEVDFHSVPIAAFSASRTVDGSAQAAHPSRTG